MGIWQMILNLTGESKETKLLKGQIFDCDKFVATAPIHNSIVAYTEMNLFVLFGDFERAAKVAIKVGNSFKQANPGSVIFLRESFLRGIALYAMARKSKKRKHKRHA